MEDFDRPDGATQSEPSPVRFCLLEVLRTHSAR